MAHDTSAIDVTFVSPHTDETLPVELDPTVTAGQALDELVRQGFLEQPGSGRDYALVLSRTGKTIPATESLSRANVVPGDALEIAQSLTGGAGV